MMTRHILIPVRIFFILGRHIMPGRESRTHVLKCLVRTLLQYVVRNTGCHIINPNTHNDVRIVKPV